MCCQKIYNPQSLINRNPRKLENPKKIYKNINKKFNKKMNRIMNKNINIMMNI